MGKRFELRILATIETRSLACAEVLMSALSEWKGGAYTAARIANDLGEPDTGIAIANASDWRGAVARITALAKDGINLLIVAPESLDRGSSETSLAEDRRAFSYAAGFAGVNVVYAEAAPAALNAQYNAHFKHADDCYTAKIFEVLEKLIVVGTHKCITNWPDETPYLYLPPEVTVDFLKQREAFPAVADFTRWTSEDKLIRGAVDDNLPSALVPTTHPVPLPDPNRMACRLSWS